MWTCVKSYVSVLLNNFYCETMLQDNNGYTTRASIDIDAYQIIILK